MQNNNRIDFSFKRNVKSLKFISLKINILFMLFFNIYAKPDHEMKMVKQESFANAAAASSGNQTIVERSEKLTMKKILENYNHPSAKAFLSQTFSLIDAAKAFNVGINQSLINTYLRTSDNYHRWDTPNVLIDILLLNNKQKKKEIFEAKLIEDKWNIFLTSFLQYISDNAFDNSGYSNKELTEATKNFTHAIINKNIHQAFNYLNEMKEYFLKQEKIIIPICDQAIEKYNINEQVNKLFEYHDKNKGSDKIMFIISAYQILGNRLNPYTTDQVAESSYCWLLFLLTFRTIIIIGAFSLGAYFILNAHNTSESIHHIIQFFSNESHFYSFMNFYDLSCQIGCPSTPINSPTTPAPTILVTISPAPLIPMPAPIPT